MSKPTTTELQWKLDALERKVEALTDMVVFMMGHLGSTLPDGAAQLAQQLHALQLIEGAEVAPSFHRLSSRIESALEANQPMILDSVRPAPDPQ